MNTTFIKLLVKFQVHMSNVIKVMNLGRMMSQTELTLSSNKFVHKRIL